MRTFVVDEMPLEFWDLVEKEGLSQYFFKECGISALVDAVIIKTPTKVDKDFLSNFPNLMFIIRAGTGFDNINLNLTTEYGITVCNTPESNSVSAFEHTISLILALIKQLPKSTNNVKKGKWKNGLDYNVEISDIKALIVGVGRIGTKTASFLKSMGAIVYGVDPYLSEKELIARNTIPVTYEEGLKFCNLISFHCPLTSETIDYFSEQTVTLLKKPIWLINTARGGIVNEQALFSGLQSGIILGAGLDVYDHEPNPVLPFQNCENIILTPHTGAYTKSAKLRINREVIAVWKSYVINNKAVNLLG